MTHTMVMPVMTLPAGRSIGGKAYGCKQYDSYSRNNMGYVFHTMVLFKNNNLLHYQPVTCAGDIHKHGHAGDDDDHKDDLGSIRARGKDVHDNSDTGGDACNIPLAEVVVAEPALLLHVGAEAMAVAAAMAVRVQLP